METLDEIAIRHGTDKSSKRHDFTPLYDRYLASMRDREVAILEIGIYQGASLRMWADYFPRGRVYGVDIREDARQHEGPRTRVFIGDQTDTELLDRIVEESGPLNVIIDDGGHRAEQQIGSLRHLWPHLSPGGVYAIEDIHTSYLAKWGMGWREDGTTVEFLKDVVDDVHARVHKQSHTLPHVASISFHYELCVLTRAGRAPAP